MIDFGGASGHESRTPIAFFQNRTIRLMSDTSSHEPAERRPGLPASAVGRFRAETEDGVWTGRLVLFMRAMAVLSMAKGLYHWAELTGFIGSADQAFENQSMAWQSATVYFAVIELVAAVGLWLATPWGAVVWLTTVVSMAVIELMFPIVYGGSLVIVGIELLFLAIYLVLAWLAAQERPP